MVPGSSEKEARVTSLYCTAGLYVSLHCLCVGTPVSLFDGQTVSLYVSVCVSVSHALPPPTDSISLGFDFTVPVCFPLFSCQRFYLSSPVSPLSRQYVTTFFHLSNCHTSGAMQAKDNTPHPPPPISSSLADSTCVTTLRQSHRRFSPAHMRLAGKRSRKWPSLIAAHHSSLARYVNASAGTQWLLPCGA